MKLVPIDPSKVDWDSLNRFPDRAVFHTPHWLDFLISTQHGEPVTAELRNGAEVVGFFIGVVVKKLGFRILGSPLQGWTTPWLGFTCLSDVNRESAFAALEELAFKELGCSYVEVADRHANAETAARLGFQTEPIPCLELDLRQSEQDLLAAMPKRKWAIGKAQRSGVTVEECDGDLAYAEEYLAQLNEVFAKHSLTPTYGVERVRELIRCVYPSNRLLLLKARDEDGKCIGTLISAGLGRVAHAWGSASYMSTLNLHPNELLWWRTITEWKSRGAEFLDMGGYGSYKLRYGCYPATWPRLMKAKNPLLLPARELAKRLVNATRSARGRFGAKKATSDED